MPADSTVYLRPPVWALLVAVVVGGCFYLAGKKIEMKGYNHQEATISVSGDAKVSAPPDIAQLSFGVQTGRQATSKAAMEKLTKDMTAIIDAVKKAGVPDKDIHTENLWLAPVYDYTQNGQVPKGFEASESLAVKVRDMDKVSAVLGAATAAGANQAGNVAFTIDNPDSLRAQARDEAIAEAKTKAMDLAKSLGVHLGKLQGFSEGGNDNYPRPPMMEAKMALTGGGSDAEAQSTPIPAGEQEINVTVNLTFEVE